MTKAEIIQRLLDTIPGLMYACDIPQPVRDTDLLPDLPDDEFDGF